MLSRRNLSYPSRRSTPNYRPVNLLRPLHPLFATPVLCFQQLAASFPKTPGWGVARFPFQRPTAHCPLLTTRSPLTTFRMNTCKSVSKQSTLTTFRMNTYEKQGEGGTPADRRLTRSGVPISSAHHMRHVTSLSPAPSLACAYFLSPRGCTSPYALLCLCGNPIWPALCFHILTNCFSRNPFRLTLICVAPGVTPSDHPLLVRRPRPDLE